MPITLRQYPKYLQSPNHIFNLDSLSRQLPIRSLFFFCQFMQFRLLFGYQYFTVFFLQSLITAVAFHPDFFCQSNFAFFIQFQIVRFPFPEIRGDDLLTFLADDELTFQRMSLLFSAVTSFLFFFGLSIVISARFDNRVCQPICFQ